MAIPPTENVPPIKRKKGKKRWLTLAALVGGTLLDALLRGGVVPTLLEQSAEGLRSAADVVAAEPLLDPKKSAS